MATRREESTDLVGKILKDMEAVTMPKAPAKAKPNARSKTVIDNESNDIVEVDHVDNVNDSEREFDINMPLESESSVRTRRSTKAGNAKSNADSDTVRDTADVLKKHNDNKKFKKSDKGSTKSSTSSRAKVTADKPATSATSVRSKSIDIDEAEHVKSTRPSTSTARSSTSKPNTSTGNSNKNNSSDTDKLDQIQKDLRKLSNVMSNDVIPTVSMLKRAYVEAQASQGDESDGEEGGVDEPQAQFQASDLDEGELPDSQSDGESRSIISQLVFYMITLNLYQLKLLNCK
jgi:hypothetical protein